MLKSELQGLQKSESQKTGEECNYWIGVRIFMIATAIAVIIASIYFWHQNIWHWGIILSLTFVAHIASIIKISYIINRLLKRTVLLKLLEKDANFSDKELHDSFHLVLQRKKEFKRSIIYCAECRKLFYDDWEGLIKHIDSKKK